MKTYDDVIAALREVVKGNEDYVYHSPEGVDGCAYSTEGGTPSCGVGVYLFRNDRSLFEKLMNYEWGDEYGFRELALTEVENHIDGCLDGYTEDAWLALEGFQMWQDKGTPWGESLEKVVDGFKRKDEGK